MVAAFEVAAAQRHDQPVVLADLGQISGLTAQRQVAPRDAQPLRCGGLRIARHAARRHLHPDGAVVVVADAQAAGDRGGIGVDHHRLGRGLARLTVDGIGELAAAAQCPGGQHQPRLLLGGRVLDPRGQSFAHGADHFAHALAATGLRGERQKCGAVAQR